MSTQPREALTISSDGRFLLDSTGKKVKQLIQSMKFFGPMSAERKDGIEFDPAIALEKGQLFHGFHIHPCNFHKECIAWDSSGNCTQSVTTYDICYEEDD